MDKYPGNKFVCAHCDEDSQVVWYPFSAEFHEICDVCGKESDLCGRISNGFYCLHCYFKIHEKECGCDLWNPSYILML
jgi:hypothetical protein